MEKPFFKPVVYGKPTDYSEDIRQLNSENEDERRKVVKALVSYLAELDPADEEGERKKDFSATNQRALVELVLGGNHEAYEVLCARQRPLNALVGLRLHENPGTVTSATDNGFSAFLAIAMKGLAQGGMIGVAANLFISEVERRWITDEDPKTTDPGSIFGHAVRNVLRKYERGTREALKLVPVLEKKAFGKNG